MHISRIIFLLPVLLGCSSVAKKMYGIKDPEIETKESIVQYAGSIGLDTTSLVTADTSSYFSVFKRIQSSIPEAEIFSAAGANLSYKQQSQDCNAGLFSFIPTLKADSVYANKDALTLQEQLSSIRDLNGNVVHFQETVKPDYYLFIYWVRWIGKLNKDHVKAWQDLALSNKNVRIKVVEVNLDYQRWWSDAFKQKAIKAMSKQ